MTSNRVSKEMKDLSVSANELGWIVGKWASKRFGVDVLRMCPFDALERFYRLSKHEREAAKNIHLSPMKKVLS